MCLCSLFLLPQHACSEQLLCPSTSHRGHYNVRFDFVLTSWSGRQHPLNQTLSYGAAGRGGAWVAEVLGRWERRKMRCSSRFDPWWGRVGTDSQAVSSHRQRNPTPRSLIAHGEERVEQSGEMLRRKEQPAWRNEQPLLIEDNISSSKAHSHAALMVNQHASQARERRLISHEPALHRRLALVVWAVYLQPSDPLLSFMKDVMADPDSYYLQIQTDQYPGGAARGNYKRGITDAMKECLRTA